MRRAIAGTIVAAALLLAAPIASADPAGEVGLLKDTLTAWSVKDSPTDQFYMSGGQWIQPTAPYPAKTQGGPLTAAATLWAQPDHDWKWYTMAVQTAGWTFNNYQRADGAFAAVGDAGAAIPTEMYLQEVATAYLLLSPEPHFLPEQGAWWRSKIAKAADFLIANGDAAWYANGNVNLGYAAAFFLSWRATGLQRFHDAYERQLFFAAFPTTNQFKTYGEFVPIEPTDYPLCSNGSAYFTESGAGGVGYDTEYTGVQLDNMLRPFILSGDPRNQCVANMLLNEILPRVDRTAWTLDTSGGTRHTETVRTVPFRSPALGVLANHGRADLMFLFDQQWPSVENVYRQPGGWIANPNVNSYSGLVGVAVPLIDDMVRSGALQTVP